MSVRELPKTVSAGDEIEVQLAPLGEWPQTVEDAQGKPKKIVQCFDEAASAAVVGNFSKELLVDLDHASVEGGSTRAYAWVTGLRADGELGLVGTFRFTEAGAEAVNSREYRFVSVAWFCDDEGRPYELDSVALTNRPNLPVRPILNRKPIPNAGGTPTPPVNLENKPERKPNMDKLKELLGLPADADDASVAEAVAALKARVDELDAAAANAEAEAFAEQNKAKCNKEVLKAQYLVNKEVAKALVAAIPAPAAPEPKPAQQILNKAAAKDPAKDDVVAMLNKLPAGKARVEFVTAHAAELAEAAKI